jgi:hypothetical protein
VAALDDVRELLRRSSPAAALRILAEYDRDFPTPHLLPEATALRVEALLQQGERARAVAMAEELLRDHEAGPAVARVRALLGDEVIKTSPAAH